MVLYSFYIFDRHTECIYSRRWAPRPSSSSGTTTASRTTRPTSGASLTSTTPNDGPGAPATHRGLSHADDEKLIFGLVFSLRNMVTKLGGSDDTFLSYRTGEYKLHYYETPTRMKFVMLTDTKVPNLRQYLYQIWANLYVEYVVKNPLAPTEHPGGIGVSNELFERGLEAFLGAVLPV
ncbi:Trafficking protein particle complex subunit BET5 [Ascochyta rabiei]|uniref:Trafficking protein particle complex subunit n=1 Tax=Didymella rabiei TaxID=5454 RepID=A0A162XBC5_DIDRA|nr:Trafficking protein particle complex subunit BET5 [Ascochyta rabiei]KZM19446.1 ER to Golgi vesicle-mediated transport [Ascochyta rabiei]UPX12450.1 Trafficking protein particle complex subunit BET5 [Ascochyta rabiei]